MKTEAENDSILNSTSIIITHMQIKTKIDFYFNLSVFLGFHMIVGSLFLGFCSG